ncbi:hypothetical protein BDN70DRAFT_467010 [Pholiota conissans]|uniref:F-box domain-containing protein n=1 Tax=Pholiota conissans TaxID=109636 RepID=A0A9P5ZCY0_9AGAR|nr:hypothetical protein BDN70DRAFT_467010 [Pholiota conissans]
MLCAKSTLSPRCSSCREDPPMNPSRPPTDIHALPVELLTWIFELGSAFDYPYTKSPFLLKPDQAFIYLPSHNFQVVAHVCRHWRAVALRTQHLWTTLHIREEIHIERAEEYISRCSASIYTFDILIDTVAVEDHIPGITLYSHELERIFKLLLPVVHRWRTFHLKVRDQECKLVARKYLTSCGPGPKLETLQLYHFEDFRSSDGLYRATYKPPVTIFNNALPCLKNVSLIGVNLPWKESLYLTKLHHLELALHLDSVRPPYRWWDRMLRGSPNLGSLSLHYSGPKKQDGSSELSWFSIDKKISLPKLHELSFTDLDPDFLCRLLERLQLPSLKRLMLDLREQDFTPFIDFLTSPPEHPHPASISATLPPPTQHLSSELPVQYIGRLETLIIRGLDCGLTNWAALLRTTQSLRALDVAFAKTSPDFWKLFTHEGDAHVELNRCNSAKGRRNPALLPHLEVFTLSGVSGKDILSALCYRFRCLSQSVRRSEKWIVRWSDRRRRQDPELDALVDKGYWTPTGKDATVKVFIDTFDYTEDIEGADDETPSTSDEEEDEK